MPQTSKDKATSIVRNALTMVTHSAPEGEPTYAIAGTHLDDLQTTIRDIVLTQATRLKRETGSSLKELSATDRALLAKTLHYAINSAAIDGHELLPTPLSGNRLEVNEEALKALKTDEGKQQLLAYRHQEVNNHALPATYLSTAEAMTHTFKTHQIAKAAILGFKEAGRNVWDINAKETARTLTTTIAQMLTINTNLARWIPGQEDAIKEQDKALASAITNIIVTNTPPAFFSNINASDIRQHHNVYCEAFKAEEHNPQSDLSKALHAVRNPQLLLQPQPQAALEAEAKEQADYGLRSPTPQPPALPPKSARIQAIIDAKRADTAPLISQGITAARATASGASRS